MSVKALIKARRTVRKFTDKPIPENLLVSYINCARLAPSAANMQVLKYVIIQSREQVSEIMPHVKWAVYTWCRRGSRCVYRCI